MTAEVGPKRLGSYRSLWENVPQGPVVNFESHIYLCMYMAFIIILNMSTMGQILPQEKLLEISKISF